MVAVEPRPYTGSYLPANCIDALASAAMGTALPGAPRTWIARSTSSMSSTAASR